MQVIMIHGTFDDSRAVSWAAVLCQQAGLRLAAGEDPSELVRDAEGALEAFSGTLYESDQMFCAPWFGVTTGDFG